MGSRKPNPQRGLRPRPVAPACVQPAGACFLAGTRHDVPAMSLTMTDDLDRRLAHLTSLRDATADLLAQAEAALKSGSRSQNASSVERIRSQLASFDNQLQRSRDALSRTPWP